MDLTLCNGLEFSVVIAQNLLSAAKMYPWMRNVLIYKVCCIYICTLNLAYTRRNVTFNRFLNKAFLFCSDSIKSPSTTLDPIDAAQ
jgi:hypothetical protein